ncbi:hypothetical protein [Hymenobacter algoricola]|uniref:hypothetical protein n=1 Tax=Hymenobacter algoricola TaxID=486267 RepID=UPI003CD0BA62
MFNVFASLAEFERKLIRARTHAGPGPAPPRRSTARSSLGEMRLLSACASPGSPSTNTYVPATASSTRTVNQWPATPPFDFLTNPLSRANYNSNTRPPVRGWYLFAFFTQLTRLKWTLKPYSTGCTWAQ